MHVMERLLDLAAERLKIDRVEIRRRNLISKSQLPYHSPMGLTYDSGDFRGNMEAALTRNATGYNRYGSPTHKQAYIYGGLDPSPTEFTRNFGRYRMLAQRRPVPVSSHGQVTGYFIGLALDYSERDSLTGLLNRKTFSGDEGRARHHR